MTTSEKTKSYLPSIDGLRALAIIFVLGYHFKLPFWRGGFIGVDIFFLLSGYLITTGLLREWQKSGDFNFKKFWLKRLRRLLPALVVMVVVILLISFLFYPKVFSKSWGDGLAGILQVNNWWAIFQEIPYFDTFGSPSPFKHLWSLGIEGQFYFFWPLVLFGLLKLFKKRQHVLKIIIGVGILSALLMAVLYGNSGIDRVYYGTDTRLFTILAGCSLGFIWPYTILPSTISRQTRELFDGLGLLSLVGLVMLAMLLNEYQSFLYRGGFVLVAVLTIILVTTLVLPTTRLGAYFSHPWLIWIGQRSYSIYLWHFPIIALTTPVKLIGTFQPLLISLQLLLTLLISELSFRWLEEPIRKEGLKNYLKKLKTFKLKSHPLVAVMASSVLLTGVVLGGTSYFLVAPKKNVQPPAPVIEESTTSSSEVSKPVITEILVIGDSIISGAEEALTKAVPGIVIDGKIGRQLVDASELLEKKYMKMNHDKALVILELGSNSPFEPKELERFLKKIEKAHVMIINTRVPRDWEKDVNRLLAEATLNEDKRLLLDWYSLAINNPALLAEDGIHLEPGEGVNAYTKLVTDGLENYDLQLK